MRMRPDPHQGAGPFTCAGLDGLGVERDAQRARPVLLPEAEEHQALDRQGPELAVVRVGGGPLTGRVQGPIVRGPLHRHRPHPRDRQPVDRDRHPRRRIGRGQLHSHVGSGGTEAGSNGELPGSAGTGPVTCECTNAATSADTNAMIVAWLLGGIASPNPNISANSACATPISDATIASPFTSHVVAAPRIATTNALINPVCSGDRCPTRPTITCT